MPRLFLREPGEFDAGEVQPGRLHRVLVRDDHRDTIWEGGADIFHCGGHTFGNGGQGLGREGEILGVIEVGLELSGILLGQLLPDRAGPAPAQRPLGEALIALDFEGKAGGQNLRSLQGPLQRRRDDNVDSEGSNTRCGRHRLTVAGLTEAESGKVAVTHPIGVVDLTVAYQM